MRKAHTIATLQSLQEFFKASNERERALADAAGDKQHAFIEYLNFLEVYSAASNAALFAGITRELVTDKLIDSIVVLKAAVHWHNDIERSITSAVTYKHLRIFMEKHRSAIDSRHDPVKAPS